ncbi:histidine kinase-, DNA gyrase B-, and HSP90-like ATPase family protein [Nocardiopsis alba ATCC BAA-2165]|uniref:histidine kinase n=2 Tax=Nocardiopsis alba TaxID=53437 RepID=J7L469_NOCAA|nr:histidine kinase-, DNA gyrase B-, and HSP90-like ATPase family protein [Nocardiopsis alba ATCC BAA-2165]
MELMRQIHALGADLRDGLHGRGVGAAARRLRRLLSVDGVLLADLDGPVTSNGTRPDAAEIDGVLAQVFEYGGGVRARTADGSSMCAVPLHVADELAGALVAIGDPVDADVEAAAALVSDNLDHAALRRARARIAAADLRTLRAQISPHFVHNALAVIAALVRTDPDRSRRLLSDFADYLRYGFSDKGDYATVADELEATQTYLELQRARFHDRLDITVRMAPEVLPVAVPFLVVQPIVENAIRHGLERKEGRGHISVSGFGEGPLCVIEIEDDGVGMHPELARALLAGTGPESRGVGLANVDQRLRAVYGPEYGLVIETALGEGTKVTVRVPRFAPGVVVG